MLNTLDQKLFEEVLIEPALERSVDRLQIVSGYATPEMVKYHNEVLTERVGKYGRGSRCVQLELLVGMVLVVGIKRKHHREFQDLVNSNRGVLRLACRYVTSKPAVHANTYRWFEKGMPYRAFSGSACYSFTGFSNEQIECVAEAEPENFFPDYDGLFDNGVNCLDLTDEDLQGLIHANSASAANQVVAKETLSFLVKGGETPATSGINWGQREGRNKNQAYIQIPAPIQNTGFFPKRKVPFDAITDDGVTLNLVRAQANGKGIHTTNDNSILGKYIRMRLGIESGAYVKRNHLKEYGRTDITFCKHVDGSYSVDFSVEKK